MGWKQFDEVDYTYKTKTTLINEWQFYKQKRVMRAVDEFSSDARADHLFFN